MGAGAATEAEVQDDAIEIFSQTVDELSCSDDAQLFELAIGSYKLQSLARRMINRPQITIRIGLPTQQFNARAWFDRLVLPLNIHLRRETSGRVLGVKRVFRIDASTLSVELLRSRYQFPEYLDQPTHITNRIEQILLQQHDARQNIFEVFYDPKTTTAQDVSLLLQSGVADVQAYYQLVAGTRIYYCWREADTDLHASFTMCCFTEADLLNSVGRQKRLLASLLLNEQWNRLHRLCAISESFQIQNDFYVTKGMLAVFANVLSLDNQLFRSRALACQKFDGIYVASARVQDVSVVERDAQLRNFLQKVVDAIPVNYQQIVVGLYCRPEDRNSDYEAMLTLSRIQDNYGPAERFPRKQAPARHASQPCTPSSRHEDALQENH